MPTVLDCALPLLTKDDRERDQPIRIMSNIGVHHIMTLSEHIILLVRKCSGRQRSPRDFIGIMSGFLLRGIIGCYYCSLLSVYQYTYLQKYIYIHLTLPERSATWNSGQGRQLPATYPRAHEIYKYTRRASK